MKYVYSLIIGGGTFPEPEPEKQAETWYEVIQDAYKANASYKRFGRKVIRIDYTEDGSQVKSMPF